MVSITFTCALTEKILWNAVGNHKHKNKLTGQEPNN